MSLRFNQQTLFRKTQKLLGALGDVSGDQFLKRDLAMFTRAMLYKRIKAGNGVNSDRTPFALTQSKRFTPLSKNYKKYRRTGIVEFEATRTSANGKKTRVKASIDVGVPALGEFGSPNRSNLTFSGQLLSSMQFDIRRFGFTILIPETTRRDGKATNAQIARWLSRAGRPFMNLTSGEVRIVKSRMKKELQKRLRKLLR